MIRIDHDCLRISGPLTVKTVGALAAVPLCAEPPVRAIDLGEVSQVDSAAVALLLHWVREAGKKQCAPSVINVPPELHSLAALYDVTDILGLSAAGNPPV
ncbi:lipid asymmetry maintenance protein MlaB [Ferrigenium sp. UT5]|uniref:STAS domain-containing protein n=1 Tax=Ferrigenium sp. UT5 TaxID=3242105 RepID=UPI00354C6BFC